MKLQFNSLDYHANSAKRWHEVSFTQLKVDIVGAETKTQTNKTACLSVKEICIKVFEKKKRS